MVVELDCRTRRDLRRKGDLASGGLRSDLNFDIDRRKIKGEDEKERLVLLLESLNGVRLVFIR